MIVKFVTGGREGGCKEGGREGGCEEGGKGGGLNGLCMCS